PVISPDLASIAIVPICPHTLNARPIVVGADEKIKIKCADCAHAEYKLTADGQEEATADSEIEISRSKTNAKMLLLSESENNFYTILREKFGWGVAPKK
ncbi:NAD(+)/NADH kinase, partial [bacterium]|nr:NAD(+)/NADH kinase [bacterium]